MNDLIRIYLRRRPWEATTMLIVLALSAALFAAP